MKFWFRTVVVALMVGASVASAEVAGESPRHFMLEAKLGPYTPLVDRQFLGTGPYQSYFDGAPMLLGELEFDWQFFQKVGSASLGASAGYAEKYGRSLNLDGTKASTSTGLHVVPLKAILSYRFDYLSLKFGIPLVPYVKAAFLAMPWWVVNGGAIELANGLRGQGIKYGFAGVGGLAVTLDFLDHRLARDFDTGIGVNHTYLFAEFTFQETLADSATNTTPLDLSSRHAIFGLALEF